jgi:hypothetical protein
MLVVGIPVGVEEHGGNVGAVGRAGQAAEAGVDFGNLA